MGWVTTALLLVCGSGLATRAVSVLTVLPLMANLFYALWGSIFLTLGLAVDATRLRSPKLPKSAKT